MRNDWQESESNTTPSLHHSITPSLRSFLRNLPSPAQNLGLRPRSFRFLDVAIAVVEKGQAGPGDLIIRTQLGGAFSRLDCLRKMADFHECHSERVPAIEKLWIHLDAAPIFLDCALQLTDGEVTISVVE